MSLKSPCRRAFNCAIFLLVLSALSEAGQAKSPNAAPVMQSANFTDVAEKAGRPMQEISGGIETKKYIIDTTGTIVALVDYDNDCWPDIFIVIVTRLEG